MRTAAFIILLVSSCFWAQGQSPVKSGAPPKHEFRAVWVTTLANIDWPSQQRLSTWQQQQEFLRLLDRMQGMGMNAVMVQVRPAGDAFYPSKLAPWSQYLTGTQGKAPEPYYDPLEFMIRECHARNIEFHAWFNPFRAVSHIKFSNVAASNPVNAHPDWCFDYGDTKYFDPGHPEARDHIIRVIMEVVRNYDIDGVHLDDYFYPYPRPGQTLPDDRTWKRFGGDFVDKASWRRYNVDEFVGTLSDSIYLEKQWVKFGVSPFGVWRNQEQDSSGSASIRALSGYDELYADARKWLELGWVDYLAPQLYWNINSRRTSFSMLLNWWGEVAKDRHLYVGHAAYLMAQPSAPLWASASEFMAQVDLCRSTGAACGNIWFRAGTLMANPGGLCDGLCSKFYNYPAMPPPMPWLDSVPPNRPRNFTATVTADGVYLAWRQPTTAPDLDVARYYIVYRFEEDKEQDFEDPRNILSISTETHFSDISAEQGKTYLYAVTAVDRLHNESEKFVYQWVTLNKEP